MFKAIKQGIYAALITILIGGALVFLSAPVFLGLIIITGSAVMTVWTYSFIAFTVASGYSYFKNRNAKPEPTGQVAGG